MNVDQFKSHHMHAHCIVDESRGPVNFGGGCEVGPNVVIIGPVNIANNVRIFPGAIIGCEGEHREVEADWDKPIPIGDNTVIRENVVIQRGIKDEIGTQIGDNVWLMHGCHVGHDAIVSHNVTAAPRAVFGGHVKICEGVYMGIHSITHQFVVVGHFACLGMGAVVIGDVPPGNTVAGCPAKIIGPNTVGIERAKATPAEMAVNKTTWENERQGRPVCRQQ